MEAYTYDALNRLSTVNYGDGLTQSYGFDPMGNRLQKTDSSAGTTTSTYDAANRLTATTGTGASTYTSDADGNTLTGGGRTNTWDSQNRQEVRRGVGFGARLPVDLPPQICHDY